jgi:hypothetical protein
MGGFAGAGGWSDHLKPEPRLENDPARAVTLAAPALSRGLHRRRGPGSRPGRRILRLSRSTGRGARAAPGHDAGGGGRA